jgi:DNA-binding transcriptional LysR family regulator
VRQLFDSTDADGVFLLQDDVVFNADWYERMLDTVSRSNMFTDKPIGVLAGIKLNHKLKPGERIAAPSGITAQCLYISRRAFDKVEFLRKPPAVKQRFDDLLRRSMVTAGLWGGVIYPFVCQHIGVQSLVRPHKRWTASSTARVGYYAHPPYTMSDSVRVFRG